ncbi:MAG: oxidoreductase domain protein [Gammaproteobacteria bacterium]|nr:oxidoreductase domain protein [Gammaproteobacteria bacterium]
MNVATRDGAIGAVAGTALRRPRIGFAGVGWIGLNRLQAVAEDGAAEIVCITDLNRDAACSAVRAVTEQAPDARVVKSFDELLAQELDGVVIATPSGQHAQQTMAALARNRAVFCQKPLAATGFEVAKTISTARDHDRLLAVDFCYRTVAGVSQLVELTRSGALGEIFAADLVFHNAYGPDKPWFYDLRQSGGGCVMDLGIHLADLLLLVLDYPRVARVDSRLHAGGRLLSKPARELEDHAFAQVQFEGEVTARIACSWRLSAGQDAVIEAAFYGTRGAGILRNVRGSFYDFTMEHCEGTARRVLASGPDKWGGRAAVSWSRQLAVNPRFDEESQRLVEVAELVDAIYGR